ncbi:hypothetical protein J1N35_041444 [Gossypium stocksii]|uniref:Uncharacterized protein n=1 Tax=Gossypium stocksii TaxID=47602 RepID=A0A9D3ZJE9_9ROSI|nr:hypothetical protein J1N35_041444 [Gossypium stocksii]
MVPSSREYMCMTSVDYQVAEKQNKQLKRGFVLDLVELVSVRNVFQYCLQDLSSNGCRPNVIIELLDDLIVPSTSKVWPYNSDSALEHILAGCKREPLFIFTTFVVFTHAIGTSYNIDITTILNEAQLKEKIIVAPSRKITKKKSKKRLRLDETVQETRSSECPPLTRRRPNKKPTITVSHSSSAITFSKIPVPFIESAHEVDSQIYISDPPLKENLTKAEDDDENT